MAWGGVARFGAIFRKTFPAPTTASAFVAAAAPFSAPAAEETSGRAADASLRDRAPAWDRMEAKTPVLGGDASEEEEGDEDEDNDDDDEEGNRAAVNEAEAPDSVSRREAGAGRRRR